MAAPLTSHPRPGPYRERRPGQPDAQQVGVARSRAEQQPRPSAAQRRDGTLVVRGELPGAAGREEDDAAAGAGGREPGEDGELRRCTDVVGDHDPGPPGSAGQPVGQRRPRPPGPARPFRSASAAGPSAPAAAAGRRAARRRPADARCWAKASRAVDRPLPGGPDTSSPPVRSRSTTSALALVAARSDGRRSDRPSAVGVAPAERSGPGRAAAPRSAAAADTEWPRPGAASSGRGSASWHSRASSPSRARPGGRCAGTARDGMPATA